MSLHHDLALAWRSLLRSPVLTLTAVVSLGVGIAGSATVFSLADALLFRTQPGLMRPDRLVDVGRVERGAGFRTMSYPNYRDLRDRNTVFSGLAAYRGEGTPFGLTAGPEAMRVIGGLVSANYFQVLGVPMAIGRGFLPAEERTGEPVAVLGHALWRAQFNADPAVAGRRVLLSGRPFTVIGVAAAGFRGYGMVPNDLWVPLTAWSDEGAGRLTFRAGGWLMGVGRLADRTTLAQARSNLQSIASDLEREYPEENRGKGVSVGPSSTVPQSARGVVSAFVSVLFVLVSLVLAIACMNVGGTLAARSAARSREMAVRLALGAGRYRLFRLVGSEGVLLAALGSLVGTAGAWALVRLLNRMVPVLPLDVAMEFRVDWRVVAFSMLLSLAAGVFCGLVPAFQSASADVTASIKTGGALVGRRLRLRQVFVTAQIAFSVLLAVCAVLLAQSVRRATSIDPGFVSDRVDVAVIDLRLAGYDETSGPVFADDLLGRLEQLPGVRSVASSQVIPLTMVGNSQGFLWQPERYGQRDTAIDADWNLVTPRYFETLGVPIAAGRSFSPADTAQSAGVAIVNETLAAMVWPGQDPIGRVLVYGESERRSLQVIGVARDAKYRTLGEEPQPFIYVPFAQFYDPRMSILIKRVDASVVPAVRALLREMNPNLPMSRASALSDATAFGLVPNRIAAWTAVLAGLVGALLAALGVYGVTSHYVSQRTREIGIRMALGGLRSHVVRLVVRRGAALGGIGALLGLALAVGAAQLLAALLFAVEPDAWSFGGGVALAAAISIAASLIPARRAASVNPVEALRQD